MKKIITFCCFIMFSFSLFAGGFQINEHGARPMGMGGAFTAVADDASAIYWNGANLVNMCGTNFLVGTALISPSTTLQPATSLGALGFNTTEQKMKSQIFFPSHFFASHKITTDFAAGFGFTTPFGLGTKWEDDFTGRYLALETELMVFTISPVLAYRLTEGLSVSAGFVYSFANVTLTRNVKLSATTDALVDMEGDDKSAFGFNLGLMYKPTECLSFGASFRSQVDYNFEGTVTSTPALPVLPSGDIKADLTTPMNLVFGVAYQFTPKFLMAADFQYVGWESYDSLTVKFANGTQSSSPRLYENSFVARLGGSYQVTDMLGLLAGVYYDKNPVKSERINPSLPEADRMGLSFGLEYAFTKSLGVQLSYLYIHAFEMTIDDSKEYMLTAGVPEPVKLASALNGTYNSNANLVSLSVSYGF